MYEFEEKRLEKLATMRAAGLAAYPHGLRVTHTTAEVERLVTTMRAPVGRSNSGSYEAPLTAT